MRPCPQWAMPAALADAPEMATKPHASTDAARIGVQHLCQAMTLMARDVTVQLGELQRRTNGENTAAKADALEPRQATRLTTDADTTHLVADAAVDPRRRDRAQRVKAATLTAVRNKEEVIVAQFHGLPAVAVAILARFGGADERRCQCDGGGGNGDPFLCHAHELKPLSLATPLAAFNSMTPIDHMVPERYLGGIFISRSCSRT